MSDITTTHTNILLLISSSPDQPLAKLALRYTSALLAHQPTIKPHIFFYGEGAYTANALRWQTADQLNLTQSWQQLAQQYQLTLPVCVSTALARGVTDHDNAQRHHLTGSNIAQGFQLVGLSELAMMFQNADRIIQF